MLLSSSSTSTSPSSSLLLLLLLLLAINKHFLEGGSSSYGNERLSSYCCNPLPPPLAPPLPLPRSRTTHSVLEYSFAETIFGVIYDSGKSISEADPFKLVSKRKKKLKSRIISFVLIFELEQKFSVSSRLNRVNGILERIC